MERFEFPVLVDSKELVGGEEIIATLSFPEAAPGSVSVPGYDIDAEVAAAALGFDAPIGKFAAAWQRGISWFLTDLDRLEAFVFILNKEDENILALFEDKNFLAQIFNKTLFFIHAQQEGNYSAVNFFAVLDALVFEGHTYDELDWNQALIKSVAEMAWAADDLDLIKLILPIYKDGELAELTEEGPFCEEIDDTRMRCQMHYEFYYLGVMQAEWATSAIARFTDAALEEWEFEEDNESGEPPSEVVDVLNELDEDTDWLSRLESECAFEKIDVPEPDSSGDFAVFIDGSFHGRFEDLAEAERFVEMSREVISREGLGNDVGVFQILEGREEEAEEEGEYFDEEDIDNWEEII